MKQGNTPPEEENQYIKTETQMTELADKDIKTFVMSIFHMFRVLQERLRMSNTGM